MKTVTQVRNSIPDVMVTSDMITAIADMVIGKLSDVYNPSQKEIVSILIKTRLSYATIARVVKELLPDSAPTANSIRSLATHIKNQDRIMSTFLDEIKQELYGND